MNDAQGRAPLEREAPEWCKPLRGQRAFWVFGIRYWVLDMSDGSHVPIEQIEFFSSFVDVAVRVWLAVGQWDRLAQDMVGKQLVRAVDSIGANLVEGDGRYTTPDGLHFFIIARASAREARYWLERARTRGLLSESEASEYLELLAQATRRLNGLINYRRGKQTGSVTRETTDPYATP